MKFNYERRISWWIDYKKLCDNVRHSWLWKCLRSFRVNEKISNFLKYPIRVWIVELTCKNEWLGNFKIHRDILWRDLLSSLLFFSSLIPQTSISRKSRFDYEFTKPKVKINNLLCMADLKVNAKMRRTWDSLT